MEEKQNKHNKGRKLCEMKKKSREFVKKILEMCDVEKVDAVERGMINHKHAQAMIDFLPEEADDLLVRLFKQADANRGAVHLIAETEDFLLAGFHEITPAARILICRIIGSQGREIEITGDGIIVSPHSELCARKRELQSC